MQIPSNRTEKASLLADTIVNLLSGELMSIFVSISLESISDFSCLEHPTDALPRAPDFMFGTPAKDVLTSYFASRYLHEVGVYRCENIILEDAALLRNDGAYIIAPQVNLHADKVSRFIDQRQTGGDSPLAQLDGLGALIAGPGQNVYGHWLVDFLPKLYLLAAAGYDIGSLKYIFSSTIPKFGSEFLRMLGIPDGNVVLHDFAKEQLLIKTLLVPTKLHNGVRSCASLTAAANFLSKRVKLSSSGGSAGPFPQRVLISRSGWKSRSLWNRQEIEAMAVKAGFSCVKPERLTLRDQVELFLAPKRSSASMARGSMAPFSPLPMSLFVRFVGRAFSRCSSNRRWALLSGNQPATPSA
jgi:hypothetical protein